MNPERNVEIKRIFLDACDLKGDERAAFLARACAGDPQLRAEVDELLVCDEGEDLITARQINLADDEAPDMLDTRHLGLARKGRLKWVLWGLLVTGGLIVCFLLRGQFSQYLLETRAEELRTVLETSTRHLRIWIEDNLNHAEAWARDPVVIESLSALAALDPSDTNELEILKNSELHETLRTFLRPMTTFENSKGYDVLNPEGFIISSDARSVIGRRVKPGWGEEREWRARGNSLFVTTVRPNGEVEGFEDSDPGRLIAFSAPVGPKAGPFVANLGRNYGADAFFQILLAGSFGDTGETYAFDEAGRLLTESRFNSELKRVGLLPDEDDPHSSLVVTLRDPGGDLQAGFLPMGERADLALTEPVARALAGRTPRDDVDRSGLIAKPYRNYLGRQVIGVWQWIPDFGHSFGIVTEVEVDEALRTLWILDRSAIVLFALFFAGIGLTAFASHRQRQQTLATTGAPGQYKLIRKIGEGGLGEVFLAEHVLMKRPTAIKFLREESTDAQSVKRFEREVRLAGRLTHPNTIQIYDYGLTGEGRFYYAMEYLEGLNLAEVVEEEGRGVPVSRVIPILLQTLRSLAEAHQMGLIHRDIKPQNILLCKRGGQFDLVKVVDFGLAKKIEGQQTSDLTAPHQLSGTLLYMAPERIRSPEEVDARTDLYSVGALGYFLLTGESPFPRKTDLDVLYRIVNETPDPPSKHSQVEIPTELEALIMSCLDKDMAKRPSNAVELVPALEELARDHPWTQGDARSWWERRHAS